MSRSLTVAMSVSLAVHLALFVLVDWLLPADSEASASRSVLLVSIEDSPAAVVPVADAAAAPAADAGSAIPADSLPAAVAPDTPPAAPVVTAPLPGLQAAHTAAAGPDITDAADSHREPEVAVDAAAAAVDVVTTSGRSVASVALAAPASGPPVYAQAAFSRQQEKMLNRRLKEWTEELHDMRDGVSSISWDYRGQEYRAEFRPLPVAGESGIERVIVEISTEEDGKRLWTEVQLKRLAFSSYAQFVNRWDPEVQVHDDELDGRFHSNTEISLAFDRDAKPLFHDKVTTSARRVNFAGTGRLGRRKDVFRGGLQTGVKSIRLPKCVFPFPGEPTDGEVHRFDEDARIRFYADGSYGWRAMAGPEGEQRVRIEDGTAFLVAGEDVTLHVKGVVRGMVLVYSPTRIVIEDDLVYARDPQAAAGPGDYLGLVSDRYVDVAPPEVTGPGDLSINAAIYAGRRFAIRRYRAREHALLYLFGSLSAGSMSATEPRYRTRIRFDPRFEEFRPPGFPVTDRYEVESRDPAWTVN